MSYIRSLNYRIFPLSLSLESYIRPLGSHIHLLGFHIRSLEFICLLGFYIHTRPLSYVRSLCSYSSSLPGAGSVLILVKKIIYIVYNMNMNKNRK